MQRRHFLALGLGGTLLIGVGGFTASMLRSPATSKGNLSPAANTVFRAVANAVLAGSLANADSDRARQLQQHLERLAVVLDQFPAQTRSELAALLNLLAHPAGRLFLAGLHTEWAHASSEQLVDALQTMRTSRNAIRQQTYHALRDLTNATFYSAPSAWPLMGYPGPTPL